MFSALGEEWFDDYWINYRKIRVKGSSGNFQTIQRLTDFVVYRGGDPSRVVSKAKRQRKRARR